MALSTRSSKVCLQLLNYKVVPMKLELRRFVPGLHEALHQGAFARQEQNRAGFYDIELAEGCFYIHVYDAARTVYLIARFVNEAGLDRNEKPALETLKSLVAVA